MIRSYVGTVVGNTTAVYKKGKQQVNKIESNGFFCVEVEGDKFKEIYFSKSEEEIDKWLKDNFYTKVEG